MNWKFTFLFFATMLSGGPANSSQQKIQGNLTGTFYTGGAIDRGDLEEGKSHFYIWLEGEGARALFEQLETPAEEDVCLDDGSKSKFGENIQCTVGPEGEEYKCYFSINVPEEKIELGVTC